MTLPTLTICILTYKRPWYALPTIYGLRERMHYDGEKRFVVIDGGSSQADLDMYSHALRNEAFEIVTGAKNLAHAHNMAAWGGGDAWLVCLDDYELQKNIDITPDVELMEYRNDVGCVRLSPLAYWAHSTGARLFAEMIEHRGYHYWLYDKERSTVPHTCLMAAMLYHRRFWNEYGDIPIGGSDLPGDCEIRGAERFNHRQGSAIAWPMRFGDGESEPFRHIGYCRSDDYASKANDRWGAIDVLDSAMLGNVRIA